MQDEMEDQDGDDDDDGDDDNDDHRDFRWMGQEKGVPPGQFTDAMQTSRWTGMHRVDAVEWSRMG